MKAKALDLDGENVEKPWSLANCMFTYLRSLYLGLLFLLNLLVFFIHINT